MSNEWELIRAIHSYKTNVPPHVVDLIAVKELLRLYAEGTCVTDISLLLSLDVEYVRAVLQDYYSVVFVDWSATLEFNPYKFYKESSGDLDLYIEKVCLFADFVILTEADIIYTWLVCKEYEIYKKEIEEYEGN